MPIRAQLFDGTILEFPDGTSPDVINSTAKRMTDEVRPARPPEETPEKRGVLESVIPAIKRGFGQFGEIGAGYSLAGSKLVGDEASVAKKMAEAKADIQAQKDRSLSVADIQRIYKEKGLVNAAGEVPQFLVEQTLQSLPTMATPLAAGMATTALTAPILGPFAPVAGTLAGIGTYGLQTFGSGVQRQAVEKKKPEEIELGKAAAASAIGAPLGYFMDRLVAMGGAKSVKEAAKELASRKAAGEIGAAGVAAGVAKQTVKGTGVGFIAEAPTETLEAVLDRWQAGLPLTGEEAKQEYLEAGIGGGGVGGTIGGASRGVRTYSEYRGEGKPEQTEFERRRAEIEGRAPAPTPFDEASPLENPYGNIPAADLGDIATQINDARVERKQAPLQSFSVEDIVNAGLPAEQTDQLLSGALTRAGFDPSQTVEPQDILDAAKERGIDTEQPGFRDFLRRSSGAETPAEMTPVQRVAAFGAIQSLPEGVDSLPTGTNAQNFTEPQYKAGLKAIKGAVSGGSSRDGLISAIQKTGVENIQDAQSILQAAIKDGQVGAVSIPSFTVLDDFGRPARVYENRQQAEQLANRLNGQVQETSLTKFVSPELAGADIRPGTYAPEPSGFEIKVGDTTLASAPTIEEVEQKADRFQQIRQRLSASKRSQADQMQAEITQNRESLEGLEATGQAGTKDYAKLQKQVQTKNKKLEADRGRLLTEAKTLDEPLRIGYAQPKRISPEGFTRFEGGLPVEQVVAPVAPVAPAATDAAAIDALQKKLMPALKRFGLENIGLRVVKKIEDGGAGADGAYANLLIQVALSADNPMGVMRHEVIHALKELGAFTAKEWRVLESKAKSEWIDRFIRGAGTYERYQDVYQQNTGSLEGFDEYIAEEAIAEAFKYFDATKPPPGLVGNLFGRIRNFFSSLRNALQGAGFQTAEEVLGRIEEGKVTPTRAEAPAAPRYSYVYKGPDKSIPSDDPRGYKIDKIPAGDSYTGKAIYNVVDSSGEIFEAFDQRSDAIAYINNARATAPKFSVPTRPKTRDAIEIDDPTPLERSEGLAENFVLDFDKYRFLFTRLSGRPEVVLRRKPDEEGFVPPGSNFIVRNDGDRRGGVLYPDSPEWPKVIPQSLKRALIAYSSARNDKTLVAAQEAITSAIDEINSAPVAKPAAKPRYSVMKPSEVRQALTQNVTGEVIPSVKTEMAQVAEVPMMVKQKLTDDILRGGFVQQMAGMLNIRSEVKVAPGTGGYEGSITPNLIVQVFHPNPEVSAEDAAKISAAMTYVFKQDAVPYFRADPRLVESKQLGYRITFDTDRLTEEQEQTLFRALRSIMGEGAGYTKMAGNQMVLINFRGEDGNPFLMDDSAFARAVQEFKETAGDIVNIGSIDQFGVESEYPYHDWKDDAAGAGIIAGLQGRTGGRPNIQNGLDNLRKSFVDSARESVRSAGLEPRFSLSAERGDPRDGKRVTTDTIEVDGEDRPTRTSKGTLIFPTEEGVINFWRWFGNSVFVDEDGRPLVMYHGTAADIEEFIPKQANAIFITPRVEFAAEFKKGVLGGVATWSENWMVEHYDEILTPEQIERVKIKSLSEIDPETKKDYKLTPKSHHSAFTETAEFNQGLLDEMPSRANVIPLFVKAENPFNYSNENHVRQVVDRLFLDFDVDLEQDPNGTIRFMNESTSMADKNYSEAEIYKMLNNGYWPLIEQAEVQDVIRELGFDGFSVQESLVKNFGVFSPNQVKSAVGNDGNFSDKKSIRFSIAQSKTPQFKRWFGDSKIVDRNGNPLMMYHATTVPEDQEDIFSVFNRSDDGKLGQGIYTTALSKYAESFAPQGSVMPLWVSIQNPLYIDLSQAMQRGRSPRDILRAQMAGREAAREVDYLRLDSNGAKEIGDRLNAEIKAINGKRLMDMSGAAIRRTLQRAGYDGIVVRDADGNFVEVNAFEPTQIKSATGNRGTFSRSNKDIRYSFEKDIKGKAGLGQAAVDEIKRTTAKRDEEGFIQRFISVISPDSAEKFRALYIQKYQALERNTKAVADRFGESRLLADQSAIAAALMSHRASGIAGQSYISGVPVYEKGYTRVDDLGGKVKGLIPIFEPLMKYNDPFVFQAFQFYGATRRGARLFKEGREKLLTPQDIRFGKLLEKEYPEFKQVFDEYQKYNRGLVKFLVDTGVLTEEMGRKWTMYADYIPFYRQADGEETLGPKLFHNLSGVQPSKKLKGGTFKLDDFLETVVRNTKSAIEQGMKNVAAQRAVNEAMMLNTPGQFDYAKKLPAGAAGGPDIVNVREKGVDVKYEVADPLWLEAMKGLYAQNPYENLLKIVGFPTRMLRNIVTKMPDFMVANLLRDSMSAWVTSGSNFKPVIDTFKQAGKELIGSSPEANLLRAAGVATGYEFAGDVKASAKEFSKQLRASAGKRTTAEKVMLPLDAAWNLLEKGSNLSDIATRAEVARRTMAETGNEAEAVFRAIEVMNFDRMGASPLVQVMAAVTPFFNARVQGLDLLYRAGTGRLAQANRKAAHKAFMIRATTLIALSAAYWMLASDTDDYKKANEETRDNNWIIGPVKLPIPYEIGVLFKVIPERILGYFFGTDTGKDVKDSAVRQIVSTLGINPVPQAILPVLENVVNYSFFTTRPVIPKGMEDVAPQFQVTASTSLAAQKIGEATGKSPIQIDNLINGYFGALGSYTALAIDSMIRTTSDPVKPSMRLDQMPVIRRFLTATEAQGTVGAFYDLKEVVDEVTRTSNLLQNSGRYDQYAAYMKENGKLIEVKPLVQHIDKYMTALRERERQIMSLTEKDISADAKQKALESIRESRNNLTAKIRELRKQISQD